MKTVLVFKTSINSPQELRAVKPLLNNLLRKTECWNLDLEDCDRVLRVESEFIDANSIIKKLESAGVMCAELE